MHTEEPATAPSSSPNMEAIQSTVPRFVLGIGAQRAGAAWLYDLLVQHPDCAMAPLRTVHFFDDLLRPDRERALERQLVQMEGVLKGEIALAEGGRPFAHDGAALMALFERLAMQIEPERYQEMFERLRAQRPSARVIGEITPGYATLNATAFATVRDWIVTKIGAAPRVVFVLRDPVTRCLAQAGRVADRLAAATSGPAQSRTRYERTLDALDAAFAPEEVFVAFFETLGAPEEVDRLCRFLEIAPIAAPPVPAPDPAPEAPAETMAELRAFYADTYAYCRDRFGADRVDALWTAGR